MVRWLAGGLLALSLVSAAGARPFARQDPVFETTLVGVVVPDDVQPGDAVTGTVTLDPAKYQGIPGLRVITAAIPIPANTVSGTVLEIAAPSPDPQQSGQLTGIVVDIPKDTEAAKKRGNLGKIVLKVAETGARQLPLLFRRPGGQAIATQHIPIEAASKAAAVETFEVPSVIVRNDCPVISGPVGANPQVSIGDVPTEVVAAGPRSVAFEVPESVPAGPQTIVMTDSPPNSNATPTTNPTTNPTPPVTRIPRIVFDEVTVVGIGLKADGPTKAVSRGTETPIEASITGSIPVSVFARPLPKDSRFLTRIPYRALKGAPRPGERGKVGIIIENRSPGTVTLQGESSGSVVKWFDQADVARGQTFVKSKIIARRAGSYNVRARVMSMLPPALGRVAPGTGTPRTR